MYIQSPVPARLATSQHLSPARARVCRVFESSHRLGCCASSPLPPTLEPASSINGTGAGDQIGHHGQHHGEHGQHHGQHGASVGPKQRHGGLAFAPPRALPYNLPLLGPPNAWIDHLKNVRARSADFAPSTKTAVQPAEGYLNLRACGPHAKHCTRHQQGSPTKHSRVVSRQACGEVACQSLLPQR